MRNRIQGSIREIGRCYQNFFACKTEPERRRHCDQRIDSLTSVLTRRVLERLFLPTVSGCRLNHGHQQLAPGLFLENTFLLRARPCGQNAKALLTFKKINQFADIPICKWRHHDFFADNVIQDDRIKNAIYLA